MAQSVRVTPMHRPALSASSRNADAADPFHTRVRRAVFVSTALSIATDEAEALERKLTGAAQATWAALTFTGVALFLALVVAPPSPEDPAARVVLTKRGSEDLSRLCPELGAAIEGDVKLDSIDDTYTMIKNVNGCGDRAFTLHVPSKQVASVLVHDKPKQAKEKSSATDTE